VVRRLEALPQRLALRARHVGRLPPLLLQIAYLPGDLLRIVECLERNHLLAELLLDADIRPSLPVGDVAQLLHLRHQRRLRRFETLDDLIEVALRRERRNREERRPQLLQPALAGFERQVGARGERLGPRRELLQARERVAPRAVRGDARRRVARGEAAVRLGVPLGNGGVHVGRRAAGADEPVPLLAYDAELTARCGDVVERCGLGRFIGELREPRAAAFGRVPLVVLGGGRALPIGGFLLGAQPRGGVFRRAQTFGFLLIARATRDGFGFRARGFRGARDACRFRCGRSVGGGGRGRLGGVLRVALGGDALVHLAKDRACALGRALVLRARGDLLQPAAIG